MQIFLTQENLKKKRKHLNCTKIVQISNGIKLNIHTYIVYLNNTPADKMNSVPEGYTTVKIGII